MALKLESTDRMVRSIVRAVDSDDVMTEEELRVLREGADLRVQGATGIDPADASLMLNVSVTRLLQSADDLVALVKQLDDEARAIGASTPWIVGAKLAVEYQLAYVVAGFQSSIEQL